MTPAETLSTLEQRLRAVGELDSRVEQEGSCIMASVPTSLAILGCCKQKKQTSRLLPAIDRYDGPVFRVFRRPRNLPTGQAAEVYILSARFGLIPGNLLIPRYDCRIERVDLEALRTQVQRQFTQMIDQIRPQRIFVSLGSRYAPLLAESLRRRASHENVTIATGSIGGRASQLAHWLDASRREECAHKVGQPSGEATLLGVTVRLSSNEVLQTARDALKDCSRGARRFETWYVDIDNHRVAPKWLVGILFRRPVSQFHTSDARRALASLGVECRYSDNSEPLISDMRTNDSCADLFNLATRL